MPSGPHGATVYATVVFANVEGATRALSLNGDTLLGKKIVVRSSATDGLRYSRTHFLQVTASFLGLPEAKRGIRRKKSVQFCGVDFTKLRFVRRDDRYCCCLTAGASDKVHRVVDKFRTGGTQVFPVACEDMEEA